MLGAVEGILRAVSLIEEHEVVARLVLAHVGEDALPDFKELSKEEYNKLSNTEKYHYDMDKELYESKKRIQKTKLMTANASKVFEIMKAMSAMKLTSEDS